jgi:hypothetical protein
LVPPEKNKSTLLARRAFATTLLPLPLLPLAHPLKSSVL